MGRTKLHFEGEMCEECGINPKARQGFHMDGSVKYRGICGSCHRAKHQRPWLSFRGQVCESCGYTPMFIGSLDVHHRDGDKGNNEPDNLMTVCATCHRELEAVIHQCDGDYKKAEGLFKRFMRSLIS